MWIDLLMVMIGGCLGAATRFIIGLLTAQWIGTGFPWGTLAANLLGCFWIGVLFALAERTRLLHPKVRLMMITGFLGAMTSYSSFATATVHAAADGRMLNAFANVLISTIGCLSLTFAGIWLGSLRKIRQVPERNALSRR